MRGAFYMFYNISFRDKKGKMNQMVNFIWQRRWLVTQRNFFNT